MIRPQKEDYDLNDQFEAIRLARDLINYIDYLELEKQTNQEQKLHVDLVSGMWYDYDDIDDLPHGEYKVRTNFSNERIGEFFNEEWLDAKNSFDTGELVLEYYR